MTILCPINEPLSVATGRKCQGSADSVAKADNPTPIARSMEQGAEQEVREMS